MCMCDPAGMHNQRFPEAFGGTRSAAPDHLTGHGPEFNIDLGICHNAVHEVQQERPMQTHANEVILVDVTAAAEKTHNLLEDSS